MSIKLCLCTVSTASDALLTCHLLILIHLPSIWSLLVDLINHNNSRASRLMRAATAEHVISSKTCQCILRQFNCQPQSVSEVLDSVLDGFLGKEVRKEAACRAALTQHANRNQ